MPKDRSPRRRPEAKSRQQQPAAPRFRWSWVFAGISLVFVAAAAYAVLHSPLLTVKEVNVDGVDSLDRAAIVELSGLSGQSLLRLPLDAARARLLAVPGVRSVAFHREWPQGLTIEIEERRPYAYWSVGGRDYTVDIDGVVLAAGVPADAAPRVIERDSSRILAAGDRVHPDALALASRIVQESPRFLDAEVRQLEYRDGIGVTAVFSDGLRVTFGDERSYEYKVAVLAALLDRLAARGETPRAVDLRFGERVTYESDETGEEEQEAGPGDVTGGGA